MGTGRATVAAKLVDLAAASTVSASASASGGDAANAQQSTVAQQCVASVLLTGAC